MRVCPKGWTRYGDTVDIELYMKKYLVGGCLIREDCMIELPEEYIYPGYMI